MNEMTYQNYSARVEFDPVDRIFVGHIVGIRDIVGFHGSTVEELEQAFHDTVHHYVEVSEKLGQDAQRPHSSRLTLRIPTDVHLAVATAAALNRMSINQWATDVLRQAATTTRSS